MLDDQANWQCFLRRFQLCLHSRPALQKQVNLRRDLCQLLLQHLMLLEVDLCAPMIAMPLGFHVPWSVSILTPG
jgi:hypothetical protein